MRAFLQLPLPAVVIHNAIVQSERDWDEDEQSAVIFAIVCGWRESIIRSSREKRHLTNYFYLLPTDFHFPRQILLALLAQEFSQRRFNSPVNSPV
jgi:hypothetical protein